MALICFHSSRLPARRDEEGGLVLYDDQDLTRWNQELIARGSYYFKTASAGSQLLSYHLEAAIAWWHTQKKDSAEKWEAILQLYNRLLQLALNPYYFILLAALYSSSDRIQAANHYRSALNLSKTEKKLFRKKSPNFKT